MEASAEEELRRKKDNIKGRNGSICGVTSVSDSENVSYGNVKMKLNK